MHNRRAFKRIKFDHVQEISYNDSVIIIAMYVLMYSMIDVFANVIPAVGDKQFLKPIIPHHAAAILMRKKASVTDPEIKELIKNIITSRQKLNK